MITVLLGCSPIAWFADVRHADVFADALRAGGGLGVQVIDGGTAIADALDAIHAAVDDLECLPDCGEDHAPECPDCGTEAPITCDAAPDVSKIVDRLADAIAALESLA